MPTYDYVCDACDHSFELFQAITAPVETTCPQCKKKKLRRLLGTGAAVMFKGSGFYQTDYRSESYQKAAKAEKTSADGGSSGDGKASSGDGVKGDGAKSETKSSESKSAAKPAAKTKSQRKD